MKKIITLLFSTTLLASAQPVVYLVDTTHTNPLVSYSNAITLTMPGHFTNLPGYYYVTNSTTGDSLPLAFGKGNTNFIALTNAIATLRTNSLSLRSNYFNLYAVTNDLNPGDIKIVNSNGISLVGILQSNPPVIWKVGP